MDQHPRDCGQHGDGGVSLCGVCERDAGSASQQAIRRPSTSCGRAIENQDLLLISINHHHIFLSRSEELILSLSSASASAALLQSANTYYIYNILIWEHNS